VIVELPTVAFAGTLTVNCCGEPALMLSGDAGLVVAPPGNPEMAADAASVNPFTALRETVTGELVPPSTAVSEVVESERPKSGIGGGPELPPPPQPAMISAPNTPAA
jgi:hypothetical protein